MAGDLAKSADVGAARDLEAVFGRFLDDERLRAAAESLAPGKTVSLWGLWGAGTAMAAVATARLAGRPVLIVTAHLDQADELADDVEVLTGLRAQLLPAWEVDVGTDHLSDEVTGQRVKVCSLLSQPADERDEPADVIVAPVMSVLQPVPSQRQLDAGRLVLAAGEVLSPERLCEWLVEAGFEHVDPVDRRGQFARRGGIVDVFAHATAQPVRVEFFGDEIDSIRRFDLDTQRSTEPVDGCELTGVPGGSAAAQTGSLLEYLPAETIVCIPEPNDVMELAHEVYRRVSEATGAGRGSAAEGGSAGLADTGMFSPEDVFPKLRDRCLLELYTFAPEGSAGRDANLGITSLQRLEVNTQAALEELEELSEAYDVWIGCETPAERDRFQQVLAGGHPELARRATVTVGHVSRGFTWPGQKLVVAAHHEIFRRYAKVRRIRRVRAGRPIDSLLDLTEGDYVVHVAHGIAKFEGLRTLDQEGLKEEYLRLRFADNAIVHVPASRIQLVQKYIGARGRRPNLSRLGGKLWSRQKERASEAVKDMAAEMLRIQAMRQAMEGVAYPLDTPWQQQFAGEFLYTETDDQLTAMGQIDADMAQPRPMDRLLCGDVGYGKTELAMRAAFRVVEAGKQVAVLVPTTVLAEQHHRTFSERLADFPVRVESLSRFRSAKETREILKDLRAGQVDVLIGTHRILSADVQFKDLGLAVIDEEQRFGVEHKEHLKTLRATVDVLTMTATPIPRTLHLSLLGVRDISALATPPLDRRAIHTEVVAFDDELIRRAILRELAREGQVFFVHNRVMDIRSVASHVQSLVPDCRLAIAHGQMNEGELEKAMLAFLRGEIDVLVCTTIIESGLDIPSANTMIIHEADRFGLSQLHQLRGRVGRYKHRAYCYLLLPQRRTVSPEANKRLVAIEEFSDLGAGFQIAMRDLEIRGAGNILGREQSGHIAAVGYELYCQLLDGAVNELRGQPAKARRDVHLELGVEAMVPRSYVPSERQRMEVYRRMATCENVAELDRVRADLADAYGSPPTAVETMLSLAEVRVRAGLRGVKSIIRMGPDLIFAVDDPALVEPVFEGASGSVRRPEPDTFYWRPPKGTLDMPTLVTVLLHRLRQATDPQNRPARREGTRG